MAGQAIVTIGNKEWQVTLASTSWELSQGLGGLPEIMSGTGMLFDTGFEQTIEVTTMPMLFSLDIAFLSEGLIVTEVYRNVAPDYLVTCAIPAKYFLEVNAGEMAGIEPGTPVTVEYIVTEGTMPATSDLISVVVPFTGFLVMGIIINMIMRDVVETRH